MNKFELVQIDLNKLHEITDNEVIVNLTNSRFTKAVVKVEYMDYGDCIKNWYDVYFTDGTNAYKCEYFNHILPTYVTDGRLHERVEKIILDNQQFV